MKESYWGYWLMVFGVFIIVVLLLIQSFTSTNTQDYYLIKEISEASMVDAIDYGYYRTYGELKMNKEKFYEVFLRRFAEEASLTTNYTIEFAEIYEAPPKIGVKVSSKSATFQVAGDTTTFDIVNKVDAILESKVDPVNNTSVEEDGNRYTGGGSITPSNPENPSNPSNPTDETPNNGEKTDQNVGSPVNIHQPGNTTYVSVKTTWGDYNVNLACACGPIAITEAAYILGKGQALKNATGVSEGDYSNVAAGTYVGMFKSGLNGDPTSSNTNAGDSGFCGRKASYYDTNNTFFASIGITPVAGGGNFGNKTGGYADKIYEQLKSGHPVVASLYPGANPPGDSGLRKTGSGHYYTIYGYNAAGKCYNVYNPMAGKSCVSEENVNKYFTEYIAFV